MNTPLKLSTMSAPSNKQASKSFLPKILLGLLLVVGTVVLAAQFMKNGTSGNETSSPLHLQTNTNSTIEGKDGRIFTAPPRPNIILIMTDDSGYSDLGCYGGEISTPNIDELAENGIRFKHCYNNARCSPTRASLLTSQYPQTVGAGDLCRLQDETTLPAYLGYLNPNYPTLPELLKKAGYHTIMTGKWHLGGERITHKKENGFPKPLDTEYKKWPLGRGFDRFFGLIHGSTGLFKPWGKRPYLLGSEVYDIKQHEGEFYGTNAFIDFALRFMGNIRKKDKKPFFLYVPFTAPHKPLEAPQNLVDKYLDKYNTPEKLEAVKNKRYENLVTAGIVPKEWNINSNYFSRLFKADKHKNPKQVQKLAQDLAVYAAMMENVDENVGRIVEKVKEMGELDNTLILYLSDNGADCPGKCDIFNSPFYGNKSSLHEGGVKSHLVAHWPKGIQNKGSLSDQRLHVVDFMPTLLKLAGGNYPSQFRDSTKIAMEGIDLTSVIVKGKTKKRDFIFWDLYDQQAAIYKDKWKWINDKNGNDFLYDLEKDGTETINLAPQNSDIIAKIKEAHGKYAKKSNILPYDSVEKARASNAWHLHKKAMQEKKLKNKKRQGKNQAVAPNIKIKENSNDKIIEEGQGE